MKRTLTFCAVALLLSGCGADWAGHGGAPKYEQPGKPGGRMCTAQCRSAFDHCADGCGLQERVCLNEMQGQAIKDYEAYAAAQFKAHAPVELRPSDFESPEQCAATSCRTQCEKVYDSCFEKCGGKVVR